jgi:hypothetical protein
VATDGKPRAGMFRYLREAFAFRWNLLFFGGAAAAAALTGHFDVAMPLVAAAEITYLASLASLPRFQNAIDAKARSEQRGTSLSASGSATSAGNDESAKNRLLDVMRSLSDERRNRFLRLRARCAEMQRIANAVRGDTHDASGASQQFRAPALDRLLWVFLRLLLSQQAVARFIQTANEADIDKQLIDLRAREVARTAAVPDQPDDRILRSLRDSVATVEMRKENLGNAKGNSEFIVAELDRIENKIAALSEMAVNADPDALSAQVDAVAEGITQTESTIRDLQNITGMSADQSTPAILSADVEIA